MLGKFQGSRDPLPIWLAQSHHHRRRAARVGDPSIGQFVRPAVWTRAEVCWAHDPSASRGQVIMSKWQQYRAFRGRTT
jgi:hypothetical protein